MPAALTSTSALPVSIATLPSTISPRSRSRKLTADGFTPCAVVETSAGNFQAWLKHPAILPKLLGTFAAQTLAARYDADPSAAGWRRFGRLPGFTNCKPKYKTPDGLFPFVHLRSHNGEQYPMAETFVKRSRSSTKSESRSVRQDACRPLFLPRRGPRLSNLSLERFRTSSKYHDRPAAADIAFCVAAYANGMDEARIELALEDDYLSSRSQSFQTSFLHPENYDEGERLGNALAIGFRVALVFRPESISVDCSML